MTSRAETSLRRILATSSIALRSQSCSRVPAAVAVFPDCVHAVPARPGKVPPTAAIPSVCPNARRVTAAARVTGGFDADSLVLHGCS